MQEVLQPLFEWERGLPERFAADLKKEFGADALSIFLFGSTARQSDEAESDIDLLIVARDKEGLKAIDRNRDAAAVRLLDRYSRVPKWILMDAQEFRSKYLSGDGFLTEILRSGRHLSGLRM